MTAPDGMEEEVLLHMYREAWDGFLDAYKKKLDEAIELIKLVDDLIENELSSQKKKTLYKEKLGKILVK